ncbi:divalent-cation tolerance protein CutA [Kitasatospora sp. NPDC093679]|uniref:divalent-cation tolerance protein CutA n=1 Tax=Kitasatospora sp. NPDC093679 TaxID=3154983 RepID=UPI00343FBB69
MTTRDVLVVTTTHDAQEKARALAELVVRERLAACAQVYPIGSVYRWEGEVRSEPEWRIDFKTTAGVVDRLTAFLREHHGYETPEVVAVPVVAGSEAYLAWVAAETAGP